MNKRLIIGVVLLIVGIIAMIYTYSEDTPDQRILYGSIGLSSVGLSLLITGVTDSSTSTGSVGPTGPKGAPGSIGSTGSSLSISSTGTSFNIPTYLGVTTRNNQTIRAAQSTSYSVTDLTSRNIPFTLDLIKIGSIVYATITEPSNQPTPGYGTTFVSTGKYKYMLGGTFSSTANPSVLTSSITANNGPIPAEYRPKKTQYYPVRIVMDVTDYRTNEGNIEITETGHIGMYAGANGDIFKYLNTSYWPEFKFGFCPIQGSRTFVWSTA